MQAIFSANFSIHWQIWKPCIHPALQVMHLTPWPTPPALLCVTFYMAWGGCPQMAVALKYKRASEKPVVTVAILHRCRFLDFNCSSFWLVTCYGWVPRTEQFHCASARKHLTQVPHLKGEVLCCQVRAPVLLGSHPGGNCSLPLRATLKRSEIQVPRASWSCGVFHIWAQDPSHHIISFLPHPRGTVEWKPCSWPVENDPKMTELRTVLRLPQVPHLSLAFTLWKAALLSQHCSHSD